MAERGGVGTRLYVAGGREARLEFSQTGDAGKRMFDQMAAGERSSNPALRALSRGVGEVKGGVNDLATSTGSASRVLGAFGGAGIVAAAGIGAIGVAVGQAKDAFAFADEIADAAQRIGVSAKVLQEYRYAIEQTGGAASDADAALADFTTKLGAAESGLSPKVLKAFKSLGFTQDDLKGFANVGDALEAVTAKVAGLSKESERAAVADKIGLKPLLPLLREGADGVAKLRKEAEDLGYVLSDDVAKKGSDANDKLAALSQVIKVQFATAFIELAPAILAATQNLADFTRWCAKFVNDPNTQRAFRMVGSIGAGYVKGGAIGGAKAAFETTRDELTWGNMKGVDWSKFAAPDRTFTTGPTGGGVSLKVGGGSGSRKAKANKYGTVGEVTANEGRTVDLTDYLFGNKKVELNVDLKPTLSDTLQPQMDQLREGVQSAWEDGIYAALDGHLWDYIKAQLMRTAVSGLASALTNLMTHGMSNSTGTTATVLNIASQIFGRHAAGGPVWAGDRSSVAEYGPEIGVFGRSGQVFDADTTRRIMAGAMGAGKGDGGVHVQATYAPNITVQGSGPEIDALRRQIANDQATFAGRVEAAVNAGVQERRIRSA